ncbi:MAG: hypothetical protein FJ314_03470 [SAR202 cluster bacterium]|nr:hypothetical protein [SAR202 cluster bacterium]
MLSSGESENSRLLAALITQASSTTIDPQAKPWLVDLHCHTAAGSDDSTARLDALAAAGAARLLDAMCVTDHDHFWRPGELPGSASGLTIFGGSEINTDAGHVLVFGLDGYEFGYHHPERLADAVERASGAMIWAHPYRRRLLPGVEPGTRGWLDAVEAAVEGPLGKLVHAVEASNGRGTALENLFAEAVARALGKPQTGASDAHAADEAGSCATALVRPVSTVHELAGEIRAGRVRPGAGSASARKSRRQ